MNRRGIPRRPPPAPAADRSSRTGVARGGWRLARAPYSLDLYARRAAAPRARSSAPARAASRRRCAACAVVRSVVRSGTPRHHVNTAMYWAAQSGSPRAATAACPACTAARASAASCHPVHSGREAMPGRGWLWGLGSARGGTFFADTRLALYIS